MLRTPEYGWSEITIGNWKDRCSYLNDVPYLLLEAVDYTNRTGKPSTVQFDAEGWEYTIVFETYGVHVITNDTEGRYSYRTVCIYLKDLIRELLFDIRRDLKAWSEWGYNREEYEIMERELDLKAWCDVIESRL